MEYKDCNDFPCTEILGTGRSVLRCESKVDILILLDSSASLGAEGWRQSHQLGSALIRALADGVTNQWDVKLGLEIFRGPKTWSAYETCTRNTGGGDIDMKATCGIEWFHHLSTDDTNITLKKLADDVGKFTDAEWHKSTTLTSVALGQAANELFHGREDANSVVFVITDGWPMSKRNTKAAAKRLQDEAKVVWVPVGRSAPKKLIQKMASAPPKDHVVEISDFEDLESPWAVNQLVSIACPRVG